MKSSVRFCWRLIFLGLAAVVLVILMAAFGVFGKMPSLKELENPSLLQSSEVYAEDGTLMGRYYLERGNRSNIDYKDISKNVLDALVATEDERFFEHPGIDYKSTLRAVVFLGRQGGGSTLTQQLAKTLLEQGSKNKAFRVIEKVKEWIISVKLERNFTKEEILALYLNAVPFGDNVYGIRNAAQTFFQKEPDRLNIEEAALLVGMLKANNTYNPRKHPKAALYRRNLVIGQMEKNLKISPAEAARLKALPIKINYKKHDENTGYAPYFREILKEEVKNILKEIKKPDGKSYDIYKDGLRIFTTINPRMQEYAEEAVAQTMPMLQRALNAQSKIKSGKVWKGFENVLEAAMKSSDRWRNLKEDGLSDSEIKESFHKKVPMQIFAWNPKREADTVMTPYDSIKYHRQMLQSSFMAMDPVTGEVKAWVGGINFKTYKFDRVNIKTKRQVGSAIKPLLYTQAMEERGFTPETECERVAQYFPGSGWVPAGKDCKGGIITMAGALAYSDNCATAYIMKQVGAEQFANFVERLNIPTKLEPHPSNALGASDLSLFEMLWAYSIYGGRGFSTKPYFINRIEDRNGNVIKQFDYSANRKEVVSEITAYKMARMMQGTVDIGTAAGMRYRLGAAEMGGKTGTTNDYADAWFFGFVPQLQAGVWVGCDDRFIRNESSAFYGGTAARPIWEYFFKKVYADKTLGIERDAKFVKPADLELEVTSADIMNMIDSIPPPGAEGQDVGVGSATDYGDYGVNKVYIGPESKAIKDEDAKLKKDSIDKLAKENNELQKPATPPTEDNDKSKKGVLKKLFGKKENE